MDPLRFAVIGTGFWANYQVAAWKELEGVELVAVYNRTIERAEALAKKFDVSHIYNSVEELLAQEKLDFVDIISGVDTHALFTIMAAEKGVNVVCQKPMASSLDGARGMVEACTKNKIQLFIMLIIT